MKIVSSGKVINSSKFYKKKKRRKIAKVILFVLGLGLVVYSSVFLFRHEKFLVREVSVLGIDVIDRAEMTARVSSMLEGFYFWVLPKANSMLLPRESIEKVLLAEFPRLKAIDLNLEDQTLFITPTERIPFALYCPNALSSTDASVCHFLDDEGLIFAPAPSFSGTSYFVYGLDLAIENPRGQSFMEAEEFQALSGFVEDLRNLGIYAKALEKADDEYRLLLISGGRIMWKIDEEFSRTYSNLEAFLSDESIKSQKDFLNNILYMDLRVEDKVFYKFKN